MAELTTEDTIIAAALDLAGARGWDAVTMTEIAAAAEVPLAETARLFPDKGAVLDGLGRMVDAAMLAGGPADAEESPRDRLFDVIMRRFDALAAHKPGVESVLRSLRGDPLTVLARLPGVERSAAWTLELAGVAAGGLGGALQVRILALALARVTWVWLRDESPDMAQTMKELDRVLANAEPVLSRVGQGFLRRKNKPKDELGGEDQPADS